MEKRQYDLYEIEREFKDNPHLRLSIDPPPLLPWWEKLLLRLFESRFGFWFATVVILLGLIVLGIQGVLWLERWVR